MDCEQCSRELPERLRALGRVTCCDDCSSDYIAECERLARIEIERKDRALKKLFSVNKERESN